MLAAGICLVCYLVVVVCILFLCFNVSVRMSVHGSRCLFTINALRTRMGCQDMLPLCGIRCMHYVT